MVADARFWTPIDGPERSAKPRFHRPYVTEVIELLGRVVSSGRRDETILPRDETISRFGADIRKRPLVISLTTKTAARRHPERRQSNANPQFHPRPRFRRGWLIGGRFVGSWYAGRRHLCL